MTTTHTKSTWWEWGMESNYGGGNAGIAYATTAPNAGTLTPCNSHYNEEQILPWAVYIHEVVEQAGQDVNEKLTLTKGYDSILAKITQYQQNTTWIDLALGIDPVETGGAALPDSFFFHFDNGQAEYTAYGCYITKYTLSTKSRDYMKEIIEFLNYDVKAEAIVGDDAPFDIATVVSNHKDYGTTTITIDGTVIEDSSSATLTVTNHYVEQDAKGGGSYPHKFPYFLKRDIEVDMEFLTYASNPLLDDLVEAASFATLVFTPFGKGNLQLTNMKVKKDSVNAHSIPEKGMIKYKVIFEIGGNCVPTTPA